MTQQTREEHLRELGYEEPFDSSPVDIPDGWFGGAVTNTGGWIFCRIWRTWEGTGRARDTEYEVIFNVSQDQNVAIQAYKWDEEYGAYMYDEIIEERTAGSQDEISQAEVAKQLMEEHLQ